MTRKSTKKNLVKIPKLGKTSKMKKIGGGNFPKPKSLKFKKAKKLSNKKTLW